MGDCDGPGRGPSGAVPSSESATPSAAAVPARRPVGPAVTSTLSTRVRHRVVAGQLDGHLPSPPGPVVDLGCGPGWLALRLARRGYTVTAVDRSRAMLEEVRRRRGGEPPAAGGRLTLLAGRVEDAVDLLGAGRFALVCCHGVTPFVEDLDDLVAVLSDVARPAGVVSLVFKNAAALPVQAALFGDHAEAMRLLDGGVERRDDGEVLRAHDVDEVVAAVEGANLRVEAWYGVLVATARRHEVVIDEQVVREAVAVEDRLGRRDPHRRVARLVHVVARRC